MCVLEQCILNFSKHRNVVESLVKHKFLGSPRRDSDSGLRSGPECADPTNSRVKHGLEQLSG